MYLQNADIPRLVSEIWAGWGGRSFLITLFIERTKDPLVPFEPADTQQRARAALVSLYRYGCPLSV